MFRNICAILRSGFCYNYSITHLAYIFHVNQVNNDADGVSLLVEDKI
jgi:hypothetical protein